MLAQNLFELDTAEKGHQTQFWEKFAGRANHQIKLYVESEDEPYENGNAADEDDDEE